MGETNYGKCIKAIPVQEGLGSFARGACMDGAYLGLDSVSLRYGLVDRTGLIQEETDRMHVHDYDQVLLLLGSDPEDMMELGAEVEITMGDELMRQRFDVPTAILIPRGMPHFSPIVRRLDKAVYFLGIHGAPEMKATVVSESADRFAGAWGEFRNPYQTYLHRLNFSHKGTYNYGSATPDPAKSIGTFLDCKPWGMEMNVSWDAVSSPQHVGPFMKDVGYRAHMHPANDELLIFFSLDQDNLTDLHSVSDFCFGRKTEREHFSVTSACVMVNRAGNFHLPLEILQVDRPFVFSAISVGFQDIPDALPVVGDD